MHVGCMGLAPASHDVVDSIPPMPSGGNLDDKRIGVGTTIAGFQSAALGEVAPHQFAIGNATMRTLQQVGYAIGVSVVVTLLGTSLDVASFQAAYTWVVACFAGAGIVLMVFYPSGTATSRAAAS